MELRSEFKLSPHPRVTAAQIGINKWEWICIDSKDEEKAKAIMHARKFDVVPIKNEKGYFAQYYSTREWNNYSGLNLNSIHEGNTIYYGTGLRDLIKRFCVEKRYFYFLSDYNEIVGLVSFANLSCQAVYNYLYFVISSIETGVSDFLKERIGEELVIQQFENRSGITTDECGKENPNHYQQALKRFKKDNQEHSFYSYLDFKDLGLVASENKNLLSGSEKAILKFQSKFEGTYNDLRLKVMHPVKTLLTTQESVVQIDELFDDYDRIMNIISDVQNDKSK